MTDADRWQEVKRLAADALERPEAERAEFLDRACTDPDVRARVDHLLRACLRADADAGFLSEPASALAKTGPSASFTNLAVYRCSRMPIASSTRCPQRCSTTSGARSALRSIGKTCSRKENTLRTNGSSLA